MQVVLKSATFFVLKFKLKRKQQWCEEAWKTRLVNKFLNRKTGRDCRPPTLKNPSNFGSSIRFSGSMLGYYETLQIIVNRSTIRKSFLI